MPFLQNIGLLATCTPSEGQGEIGVIPNAGLVWQDGIVQWVGAATDLPAEYIGEPVWDGDGKLVVPGLVDCHTHLAFGGWRADEFADRIRGRDYLEIARDGGGIASTVKATRSMDEEALRDRARNFVHEMVKLGVTTVEAKSGYGLNQETEIRQLRVYEQLAREGPVRFSSTCLSAHVVPPEFQGDREAYLRLIVDEILPVVAEEGLATFCDVFVEESAFSVEEARCVLEVGQTLGLASKLHADQLSSCGGAELAAELGAVSADHLECISAKGMAALAEARVVGVTLPLATIYLNQSPPPVREMIDAGVSIAVATDFNPGTAPSYHLPLAMTIACTRQRMTPAEVLKGATRYAARALGREGEIGSLEPDALADFALIDAPSVEHWLYQFHANSCVATVVDGVLQAGHIEGAAS